MAWSKVIEEASVAADARHPTARASPASASRDGASDRLATSGVPRDAGREHYWLDEAAMSAGRPTAVALHRLGCERGQGLHFVWPTPSEDVDVVLSAELRRRLAGPAAG